MGEPANPSKDETDLIRSSAYPLVKSAVITAEGGRAEFSAEVRVNGVVYFSLKKREFTPDRGYDYERAVTFR